MALRISNSLDRSCDTLFSKIRVSIKSPEPRQFIPVTQVENEAMQDCHDVMFWMILSTSRLFGLVSPLHFPFIIDLCESAGKFFFVRYPDFFFHAIAHLFIFHHFFHTILQIAQWYLFNIPIEIKFERFTICVMILTVRSELSLTVVVQ
jgi:hypothetical protein